MLAIDSVIPLAGWPGLAVLALVGAIASVINTMAGGGGLLVLPVLTEGFLLSPSHANGTMRVGVIVQNVSSVIAFARRREGDRKVVLTLLPAMIAGCVVGTLLATRLADALLRPIFGVVLVVWAIALVVRPGRFLDAPAEPRTPGIAAQIAALAIGLYGGFLQAGVGFPLLALLVSMLGHPPVRANAIKVALVLGFTMVSLPLFALAGQVEWREGLALALGSLVGGWLGATWQLREGGAKVVRWFVIAAVAISGAMMVIR
ncbi:MAG TPA: sulfite exporter TauE/SafE family protein [Nannocystaceae bacterium]|nr:sulfite exporter TauE/SafE family protein [Nannocystaceae bacterium]